MYDLQYYKNLDYKVIVEKDSYENESWFIAYCEELGKHACYGLGNNPQKALVDFYKSKSDFIDLLFEQGKEIPEPTIEIDFEGCNGKISFRTTPQVHYRLLKEAKNAGCSLNLFVNTALLMGLEQKSSTDVSKKLDNIEEKIDAHQKYAESKRITFEKMSNWKGGGIDPPFIEASNLWMQKQKTEFFSWQMSVDKLS